MKKRMAKRVCSLVLTFAMIASSAVMATSAATAADTNDGLRPVEYLDRGLIAAETSDGIFLSWRFLGNEPDGISWNVSATARRSPPWARDVQPKPRDQSGCKGKHHSTNYTDPDGTIDSSMKYSGHGGVEDRRGLTVAMLSSISDEAASCGSHSGRSPLPSVSAGELHVPRNIVARQQDQRRDAKTWAISEENQESWYRVDMNLPVRS
ncbi:MAG: hypothetical protein ACLRVN_06795 [Butyricicoccus sp.]